MFIQLLIFHTDTAGNLENLAMSVLGTALAFIFTMTVADGSRTMSPRMKVSDQGR